MRYSQYANDFRGGMVSDTRMVQHSITCHSGAPCRQKGPCWWLGRVRQCPPGKECACGGQHHLDQFCRPHCSPPCANGGQCIVGGGGKGPHVCACTAGFTGGSCETAVAGGAAMRVAYGDEDASLGACADACEAMPGCIGFDIRPNRVCYVHVDAAATGAQSTLPRRYMARSFR